MYFLYLIYLLIYKIIINNNNKRINKNNNKRINKNKNKDLIIINNG